MLVTKRFIKRPILLLMLLFQLLWLAGIWLTGTTSHPEKLSPILVYSLLVFLLVLILPEKYFSWFSRLKEALNHQEFRSILILLSITCLIGAYYARVQRVWSWDETNSFRAAEIVAEDGLVALLNGYVALPWLGAQHPPLMIMLYGLAMRLLGIDLFFMRLVAVLMGCGLALLTYLIGREMYDRRTGFVSVLLLLSFPLIVRQMAAAMTDVPVTLFFSLAMWLTLRLVKRPSYKMAFLVASVIGVGMLVKYTMAFIYPVLLTLLLFLPAFRKQRRLMIIIGVIPAIFIIGWGVYAFAFNILESQIETLASYAVLIMTNQLARQFALEAFSTRLPSALGVFNLPLIGVSTYFLVRIRQEAEQILFIWIAVIWLLLTVTLPDHRYFMLSFPAIAIMTGRGVVRFIENGERAITLSLLLSGGALYLFVDWLRAAHLFLPT